MIVHTHTYTYIYIHSGVVTTDLKWIEGLQAGEREDSGEALLECLHLPSYSSHQHPVYYQLEEGGGEGEGRV